jgi:hypothetical protein
MLDILFSIGFMNSAAMFAYGAYLVIRYALFPQRSEETTSTADELPEIGYYLS